MILNREPSLDKDKILSLIRQGLEKTKILSLNKEKESKLLELDELNKELSEEEILAEIQKELEKEGYNLPIALSVQGKISKEIKKSLENKFKEMEIYACIKNKAETTLLSPDKTVIQVEYSASIGLLRASKTVIESLLNL